jgi:hypothetical protein
VSHAQYLQDPFFKLDLAMGCLLLAAPHLDFLPPLATTLAASGLAERILPSAPRNIHHGQSDERKQSLILKSILWLLPSPLAAEANLEIY